MPAKQSQPLFRLSVIVILLLSLFGQTSVSSLFSPNQRPIASAISHSDHTQQSPDKRVHLATPTEGESRPMTTGDILSIREPDGPVISPDGRTVAFVLRQAFPDTNENRSAIFTITTDGRGQPVKWLEEKGKGLSHLRWAPNGGSITYLSGEGAGIRRIGRAGEQPQPLFDHLGSVSRFEWSADGRFIAFVSTERITPEAKRKLEEQGIVYNDYMTIEDLIGKSWPNSMAKELWIYDVAQQKARKLAERQSPVYPILDLALAPTGQSLAFSYHRFGSRDPYGWDINILSTTDGRLIKSINRKGREQLPSISPDGRSAAFLSTDDIEEKVWAGSSPFTYVLNLNEGEPRKIRQVTRPFRGNMWWKQDGKALLVEQDDRSNSQLYEMSISDGRVRRISQADDNLSQFSFDASQSVAACIRQNPTTPPEIAVVTLADGRVRTLTRLNPQLANLKLGEVSELTWTNKYNHKANGYLIKPVGYVAGKRYPFIVMLYDFGNKFISQAQWIASYPAQVFAGKGYAVLLMNFPESHPFQHGDPKEGLVNLVYNGLASILKGTELVGEMGVADPDKQGIMGWSRGCFMTSVTITQSDVFKVASAGDGFLFTPSTYWSTHEIFRYSVEMVFGGPPYGNHYKYYEEVSPTLRADRVNVPVLLEYVAKNIKGVEFHIALRAHGVPSEYVAYPDETHSFSQPKHRLVSMARNLDWFDFWLLGQEDPDPAKREQYQRWQVMREERKVKQSASSTHK